MQEGWFLHVAASLVVGGAFIAGCSLAAERFGTEIGGIVAGLPSTVAITLLFVALTDSPGQAVAETTFTPVALGLNCLFFAAYALAASRGRVAALAAALATWLLLAVGAVLLVPRRLPTAIALLALGLAVALVLLRLAGPPGEGLLQPMMVGGAISIMIYAMVVRYAYPSLGVGAGTVAAFIASGGGAYVLYRWRRWRRRR